MDYNHYFMEQTDDSPHNSVRSNEEGIKIQDETPPRTPLHTQKNNEGIIVGRPPTKSKAAKHIQYRDNDNMRKDNYGGNLDNETTPSRRQHYSTYSTNNHAHFRHHQGNQHIAPPATPHTSHILATLTSLQQDEQLLGLRPGLSPFLQLTYLSKNKLRQNIEKSRDDIYDLTIEAHNQNPKLMPIPPLNANYNKAQIQSVVQQWIKKYSMPGTKDDDDDDVDDEIAFTPTGKR